MRAMINDVARFTLPDAVPFSLQSIVLFLFSRVRFLMPILACVDYKLWYGFTIPAEQLESARARERENEGSVRLWKKLVTSLSARESERTENFALAINNFVFYVYCTNSLDNKFDFKVHL